MDDHGRHFPDGTASPRKSWHRSDRSFVSLLLAATGLVSCATHSPKPIVVSSGISGVVAAAWAPDGAHFALANS